MLAWLFVFLAGLPAGVARAAEPLSPRNASYRINVRLDPAARTLQGEATLSWRNLQEAPATELRFHLYWNAWRNDHSTWLREDRLRGRSDRGDDIRPDDWSFIEVDTIHLMGGAGRDPIPLTHLAGFISPDDGNPDDRTVLRVPLPQPVGPGETAQVEIAWHARIPRTFARTGYRGNTFFIAQWFPKVGVWEPAGWNCPQFHAATEFYSDYGVYDVRLTVPEGYVVGATGRETGRTEDADGSVTYRYRQEDVHDFSWTASRNYVERQARFSEDGLPAVEMRLLLQPEHLGQAERYFAAARASLGRYGTWYGPYPYGHITIVDPAYGSGAGGMEYPTLFTGGTALFAPLGADAPESVTVHEAGHQFWYGLVGNNEFEDAWLDEGLNTFSTLRTLDVTYGDRTLVRRYLAPPEKGRGRRGFFPVLFHGITVDRWVERLDRYRPSARSDRPSTPTYQYFPETAGDITYSKTALWLATLERTLGWDTLRSILSTFFQRYRFKHPTPADFFSVADEVSGRDLGWFFDQVFRDSVSFDYAIQSVRSDPAAPEGFVETQGEPVYTEPEKPAGGETAAYQNEVVVRRRENGVFPVDVLMVFEDGEKVRRSWDGQASWTRFALERPSRIAYAVVDPERKLMLDLDYTNNSRRREAASPLAAVKWGSKWMIWLEDFLWSFTFFG
ncbi:MAG: M1 family metallopeptidase [Acidobacteriota bacterium]